MMGLGFSKSERGNVAMIFAFALPVLILLVGGGIDVRQFSNNRAFMQDAADAAVLAGAKTYFASGHLADGPRKAAADTAAKQAWTHQMNAGPKSITGGSKGLVIDSTTGEMTFTGAGDSKNNFAGILGFSKFPITVKASAVAGGKEMELALILDNTSSMFDINRFQAMRAAAKEYANTMFDSGGERVRISVVPWTTVVNINAPAPAAPNTTAVANVVPPAAGTRVLPPVISAARVALVADPRDATKPMTQAQLDALATPTKWRGCIRSANGEVEVDGSGAVKKAITDGAPKTRWPAAILESTLGQAGFADWCDAWTITEIPIGPPSPPSPPGPPPPPPPIVEGSLGGGAQGGFIRANWQGSSRSLLQRIVTPGYYESWSCDPGHYHVSTLRYCIGGGATYWHDNGTRNAYYQWTEDCANYNYWTTIPPKVDGQNYACIADPNEIAYVNGGGKICAWETDAFTGWNPGTWTASANWVAQVPIAGPNINCPVGMLPLSSNRKQVIDKLNEMYPVPGGTLADVGLLWGLRTLSPTAYWPSFWGLSTPPKPWKDKGIKKIAVLLTDGANTSPTKYEGYFGCTDKGRGAAAGDCWQSPNVGLLGNTTTDNMMFSACDTMRKKYGIELYVILVDVTDAAAQAEAIKCAGDAKHAIFTSTAGVSDAFKGIVDATIRITR